MFFIEEKAKVINGYSYNCPSLFMLLYHEKKLLINHFYSTWKKFRYSPKPIPNI